MAEDFGTNNRLLSTAYPKLCLLGYLHILVFYKKTLKILTLALENSTEDGHLQSEPDIDIDAGPSTSDGKI